METISNNEIKRIRSLSQKKFRKDTGLFVVEGEKMVDEAMRSEFEIEKIYRVSDIGEKAMSRISSLSSPSPVLAVIKQKPLKILNEVSDAIIKKDNFLCLQLDGIKDPGNMGTIIRLADWFGIKYLFVSTDSVEIYNPKTVQATMGSVFRVKIISGNAADTAAVFKSAGLPVYGTFLDGENIYEKKLCGSGLIIMGSESFGISDNTAAMVTDRLLIPSAHGSGAESLNVAIATAIICSVFRHGK
ncbi:MAG: RNA methyltransferase [Bacteroidales bacterium]|jgi:TrmH family RNA methyltransferase|nr:RNA methyltransferase [Bacteroidales bacterium]